MGFCGTRPNTVAAHLMCFALNAEASLSAVSGLRNTTAVFLQYGCTTTVIHSNKP